MTAILSALNAIVLALLGLLHIYWAFGGQWAANNALPKKLNGELLFTPKPFDCIAVAIGLLAFASFFIIHSFLLTLVLPEWLLAHGLWFIGAIFTLRAIGDFRYVGFMKKVKGNRFATLDTLYYSPLCLYLGISSFFINIV